MPKDLLEIVFALLRLSLEAESLESVLLRLERKSLTKEDWLVIYAFCKKQTIIGIVLLGISKLPERNRPPQDILGDWVCQGFHIQQSNSLLNQVCAKITQMFATWTARPVILKGQANALLYPNPYCRQCGDIDVLVDGGKEKVISQLTDMGLMDGAVVASHHIHLNRKLFSGVTVEVHFKPVKCMPLGKGLHLQKFLIKEANEHSQFYKPLGFYVPSLSFALMMQMSHIRAHFISGGIGLRQLVDYYVLIKKASPIELDEAKKNLRIYGLVSMGSALMYVLRHVFNLCENQELCSADEKWGKALLEQVCVGGNFGKYATSKSDVHIKNWIEERKHSFAFMKFDFMESIWFEICYWKNYMRYMPNRIKKFKDKNHK